MAFAETFKALSDPVRRRILEDVYKRQGQSQLERAVHARLDDGGALRVRQTDILTRNDKHAPVSYTHLDVYKRQD